MPFPTLESITSDRLRLRPVQASDLPDLMAVNGDPAVTSFLPYATWRSMADAEAWLTRMEALAATGSALQLVIVRSVDAKVVGTALVFKFDEASRRVELGYVIGRAHWRQGYAKEALAALVSHAVAGWGIRRFEAEVNPDNQGSNALLRSLGFVHEGHLRERWVAKGRAYGVNVYGLLAAEWLNGRSPA